MVLLDEVSTLRKRLKQSMGNTVPFYIYMNNEEISLDMKKDLKAILVDTFTY